MTSGAPIGRKLPADALSGYELETLWADGEFSLYQGRQSGNAVSVLMLAPASGQQTSASPRWLEHEYALATKLDPAWPRSHAHSLNMKAARIAMGWGPWPVSRLLTRNRTMTAIPALA